MYEYIHTPDDVESHVRRREAYEIGAFGFVKAIGTYDLYAFFLIEAFRKN